MCGPMRGAIMGIAVFEGWASDLKDAAAKAEAGAFRFEPNHHYDAVGPMTGMTTLSQPVLVVENRAFGNRAYCAINEGLGESCAWRHDAEVLPRLAGLPSRWAALGPRIRETAASRSSPSSPAGSPWAMRCTKERRVLQPAAAPAGAGAGAHDQDTEALARCLDFIGRTTSSS